MKWNFKKTLAAIAAGAFILVGVSTPFISQVLAADKERPAVHQQQADPDKVAQRLADTYGIDKDNIAKYLKNGVKPRDINRAAFLAKASGKSLDEVMAAKTADNNWKAVAKQLGVTREQIKATRNDLASTRLEAKLGLNKETTLNLLSQGYKPRDVAFAGVLSQNTGKAIDSILDMKKINNTWGDVAQELGVDKTTLKQDMQKMHQFGGGHHRGWQQ